VKKSIGMLLGILLIAGCKNPAEKTSKECAFNMYVLWGAAASYALEHRLTANTPISIDVLHAYVRDGRAPHCPLGDVEYAPFTVASGPQCPNSPEEHLRPERPDKVKGVKQRGRHDNPTQPSQTVRYLRFCKVFRTYLRTPAHVGKFLEPIFTFRHVPQSF
jgi:hypothetical protein